MTQAACSFSERSANAPVAAEGRGWARSETREAWEGMTTFGKSTSFLQRKTGEKDRVHGPK
jgi:hypothetical protein